MSATHGVSRVFKPVRPNIEILIDKVSIKKLFE